MKIEKLQINIPKVAVIYGISRWTNSNRSSARHSDDNGLPLCRDKRKVISWEKDIDTISCVKCLRLLATSTGRSR